ncbi:diaminobutyrate acetyltransferase [Oceanobacillus kimchii]|uniref:diaminobutyrate acetyltransferase n=1 Tax=Oceanobacillus kimchii TaxID=746691 RepID=UPI000477E554|nr:diaminobutyrate acetyltransferase [Oceanobacillus kimchii]
MLDVAEKLKVDTDEYYFRRPTKEDGGPVWELVREIGNLDLNSSYSYVLWCEVFAESSIVVEHKETQQIVGFISGFMHPEKEDTLFIWQVAVSSTQRGKGLATKMLLQLLEWNESVNFIEATVAPSNKPSNYLFLGLARKIHTNWKISDYFKTEHFPAKDEEHEEELLFRIGPMRKNKNKRMI